MIEHIENKWGKHSKFNRQQTTTSGTQRKKTMEAQQSIDEQDDLIEEIVVTAVAMRYHAGPQFSFLQNQKLGLVPEPTNEYDKNAVKVLVLCHVPHDHQNDHWHVAYISRQHSKHVSDILRDGKVHSVRFEPSTSTELAATLILSCESPALIRAKSMIENLQSNKITIHE